MRLTHHRSPLAKPFTTAELCGMARPFGAR
jgi:hypothetical protein